MGINYGWERLPQGGTQYIIQLDPQSLEALRGGQPLESDVPPSAGEVRSYRIVVGTAPLPHDTPPEPLKAPPETPTPPSQPTSSWLLTLLALFASLGANVFLGWVALGQRRRCRDKNEKRDMAEKKEQPPLSSKMPRDPAREQK